MPALLTSITFIFPAKIVMDRVSDRSKGFGFVTYASEDEAEKAIAEMDGKVGLVSILSFFHSNFLASNVNTTAACCRNSMGALFLWIMLSQGQGVLIIQCQ